MILPRITYRNAFHQGAPTSFMEMVLKVPEAGPMITSELYLLFHLGTFLKDRLCTHWSLLCHSPHLGSFCWGVILSIFFYYYIVQVERCWQNFKLANGISTRQSDYETKYREMLQSQYPATWSSFRAFEATRQLYNLLSKVGCIVELKTFVSDKCDFLHQELAHDAVIFVMKDVLTALPQVFNIMADSEKQALVLEALCLCDTCHVYTNFVRPNCESVES